MAYHQTVLRAILLVGLGVGCGRLNFDPVAGDAVVPRTYADEVIADRPVAYWRFDETAPTTAIDASGNSNHAAYVGTVFVGVPGAITTVANGGAVDTAARFQGTGSVDAGDRFQFSGTAPYSLEAWFQAAKGPTFQAIFGRLDRTVGGSPLQGYAVELYPSTSADDLVFYRCDPGASGPTAQLPGTSWVHVVATYDSSQARLYTNGNLSQTVDSSSMLGAADAFRVAIDATDWVPLTGVLDEVAIYDYALDGARVLAHYTAGN